MFREMRRINQKTTEEKAKALLKHCSFGVLAVIGDNGYPYTIPLSFTLKGNSIFFHCAKTGHKIDAIKNNDKVSFCAVISDNIIPEKFTTVYESVVAFGKATILTDNDEMRFALRAINAKYSPAFEEYGEDEIEKSLPHVCVVEIKIKHITGKVAKSSYELFRELC